MANNLFDELFGEKEKEDELLAPAAAPSTIQNPAVRNHIAKLYGEKFSDDARQKLVEKVQKGPSVADSIFSAVGDLGDSWEGGAGDAGSKSLAARQASERQKIADFDAGRKGLIDGEKLNRDMRDDMDSQARLSRERDPMSQESQIAQELAKRMGMKGDTSRLSAEQFKAFSPNLQKLYEIEERKRDLALARQDKKDERLAKQTEGMTEGFKAADKDYGKDYNDFTSGGAVKAQQAINKLKELRSVMAKDDGIFQSGGGPISGSMPDMFRTQSSIAQRDNIVSVANSALKATFGGQLSDGERKALANEFYNDKLSNAENLKIIDRKIKELEGGLATQKSKANFFAKNGTLRGLSEGGAANLGGDGALVQVIAPNGKTKMIPRDQVEAALAAGGKLANVAMTGN